ncbi:hypothetical protein [Emticicia agri]|uniref:Uncharacterized protein n=1 Tax=Emticicia agri TaxID=2492393 RepID=A0A4V1ZCK0_9BACT|nr:hypothetical protein [Emticicia agri]RYU92930.1 hypothetical protein EWM59_24675 [Emticicia agri]
MTPEEKNIKNKIDNLSDIDVFFNDSQLWERVEAGLDQQEVRISVSVWYWVAASVVLVGLSFYFFLYPATTPPLTHTVIKNTATSIPQSRTEITSQTKPDTPKNGVSKKAIITPMPIQDSIQPDEVQEKMLITEVTPLNSISKTLETENSKDLRKYPVAFKAQRVTTLELPLIPDEMMARESFARRALRQIKNLNTEGKIDLRELNIEPRNVWAYLERSFFHDTTKITTPKSLKP